MNWGGSVLGLSVSGVGPLAYTFNGQAGIVQLSGYNTPTFIGFDTGSTANVNVTLTSLFAYDILGFQTAVPEAATWAMMMVGLGVVGGSLRRRRTAGGRVATA